MYRKWWPAVSGTGLLVITDKLFFTVIVTILQALTCILHRFLSCKRLYTVQMTTIHRLMDDFEEQIEEKYLLLKYCMKYTILKISYIQLFLPSRVFVLMLPSASNSNLAMFYNSGLLWPWTPSETFSLKVFHYPSCPPTQYERKYSYNKPKWFFACG